MASALVRTLEHAKFLARHMYHCDYSTVVILILYELGIAPKNIGFYYLKKAIALRYENPTRQWKDDIYAELSLELEGIGDNERIEQSIRRAITEAWKERDEEVWSLFFYGMKKETMSKPSNGDFISRVAWFVELWQGCCEEVAYEKR